VAAALVLALPASAWAHAALLHAAPEAGTILDASPQSVTLTYSEAVEPRFAIVSVTDAAGHDETTARPARSPSDPDALVVPLRHLERGWYLVYWRVISADGHPVRGAFTFAAGPNQGPAPQFRVPSLNESATGTGLLICRWVTFLSLMCSVGLIGFRLFVARPLLRRVPDTSLRPVGVALAVSLAVALVAVPVYVDVATAQFALRSPFDVGNVVPLMRSSAFGRGFLDLELVLLLVAVGSAAALLTDRPRREIRSVAALLALIGTGCAAGAALLVPGLAGHAAQFAPRGVSIAVDGLHLLAGSLWIGGLVGLTVLAATAGARRVQAVTYVVPRFSNVAFASVTLLIASGVVASIIRLPTLSSLWDTGYGQALLVKIGVLIAAMCLGAMNLLVTRPRLVAARGNPAAGRETTTLLRRLVGGEVALVVVAIFVAGVLSSLPPPPQALASVTHVSAHVGPGAVSRTFTHGPYRVTVRIAPNKAAQPNAVSVALTRGGVPVKGADVVTTFTMLDMEMGQQAYHLGRQAGGATYGRKSVPSLVMVGHWGVNVSIRPPGGAPFNVLLVDRAQS
jgi:copper transport protein